MEEPEIWTAVDPQIKLDYKVYGAIKIYDGIKITMKYNELERLQSEKEFLKIYSITTKRLNRWWYSVYFKEIKND